MSLSVRSDTNHREVRGSPLSALFHCHHPNAFPVMLALKPPLGGLSGAQQVLALALRVQLRVQLRLPLRFQLLPPLRPPPLRFQYRDSHHRRRQVHQQVPPRVVEASASS